ncbi:MAG: 2Fe-2S iron-sulfur cluster-binding protein [Saprospiraceae bacterium]
MPQFHTLTVSDVRRETSDCVSVAFTIPADLTEEFTFKAGQYITLRATIDGEDIRRSYSLCAAPFEKEWRVAIKKVEDGRFSTYANDHLKVGDTLQVMAPMGGFVGGHEAVQHIVCFAAGSGITPIASITKEVLEKYPTALVTMFYGNKNGNSIIFREELEGLKNINLTRLRIYHVLSREDLGTPMFFGRLDGEKCAAFAKTLFDPTSVDAFYLCGPEPMIRSVSETLEASGAPKEKINFELFGAPKPTMSKPQIVRATKRQADLSKVAITYDDKTVVIDMLDDGNHMLEAALSYGLELPYACQGGVCSTCKCKVTKGEVLMDVNYALEPDEVEAGFVLSCQARPVSADVAVTFDV